MTCANSNNGLQCVGTLLGAPQSTQGYKPIRRPRSRKSKSDPKRRLAQGPNANFSNSARPFWLNSFDFQRLPSFMASACSWFMIRVRICTNRCRCHSSCRRSRFSGLGTQICGKRSSRISLSRSLASSRSVFRFLTRLASISAGSPIHNSKSSSASSRSLHSYPHADSFSLQVPIESLRFSTLVIQSLLIIFTGLLN